MPPFPHLRLPALALAEIIKNTDLLDLINLMNTSMKTNNSMKRFTKNIAIELKIVYHNTEKRHVEIRKAGNPDTENVEIMNSDFEEFKRIIDFFKQFKMKNISFEFLELDPQIAQNVLAYAKNIKFKTVSFRTKRCSENIAKNILDLCSNASEFHFYPQFDNFDFHEFHNFSINTIYLMHASWVTVDHICSLVNLQSIEMENLLLTSQDVNVIIKKWMSCDLNFQSMFLQLKSRWFDADKVMNGVQGEVKIARFMYTLKRTDGVVARVSIASQFVDLTVRN